MLTPIEKRRGEKRERILCALDFKPVDRVPKLGGAASPEFLKWLTGRGDYMDKPKEVYDLALRTLDCDLCMQYVLPHRLDRGIGPNAAVRTGPLMTAAHAMIGDFTRERGAFASPEDVRDFCLGLPEADKARDYVDKEAVGLAWRMLDLYGETIAPLVWLPGHLAGTVNWMWYTTFGYESYLMAHLAYPEAIGRLFAFAGEEGRLRNIAIAEAIRERDMLPLVYTGEDICGNSGPMCSPRLLREVYFPHLKRALAPLLERGIRVLWHSDGNITPILPDLIDCGIDCFQGFEEDKGMDLGALLSARAKGGGRIAIMGSLSVTSTFYMEAEAIRGDIRRMEAISAERGGGVIIAPSSTVMEDAPARNIRAYYLEELLRAGRDPEL